MAGVLHAPLTAIFLIAEVTGGYELFIPLMITAAISYSITKYAHPHSVYAMELGRKGELITHDKDHAVLTLMDIDKVIENQWDLPNGWGTLSWGDNDSRKEIMDKCNIPTRRLSDRKSVV